LAGIIPIDDLKRLQRRMNSLMEDLGLTDLESRYMEEMKRIQDRMARIAEEAGPAEASVGDVVMPLADVRETDDSVVVTMDLPGVDKGDVDINVVGDELNVTATKSKEEVRTEENFHTRERSYTRFERVVPLPVAVKPDEARARLNNGVLEVTIPKEVVTSRRKINIE
jgi:HSP20 family protein